MGDNHHELSREEGGKKIRAARIQWAKDHPNANPLWRKSWDDLDDFGRELERSIWDGIATPEQRIQEELKRKHKQYLAWAKRRWGHLYPDGNYPGPDGNYPEDHGLF